MINLYRNDNLPSPPVLNNILQQKCDFKDIQIITIQDVHNYEAEMVQNWEPMLRHQLPQLPELSVYWDALPEFFDWMDSTEPIRSPKLGTISKSGEAYRPGYGFLRLRTTAGNSLGIIRFAAGNRLCVDLDYTNEQGERKTRRIEPYSLRRAGTGNILLYGIRSIDNETRAYRIDKINSAHITNQVFLPIYNVELSPQSQFDISIKHGDSESLGLPGYRK